MIIFGCVVRRLHGLLIWGRNCYDSRDVMNHTKNVGYSIYSVDSAGANYHL
jgi:hypothetical protein